MRKIFVWYYYVIINDIYVKICMLFIKIGCYLKVYILDVENNEEIRIVFFGKMGVGKSVFGNIIFGNNVFVLKVLVLFIISCCVYYLLY